MGITFSAACVKCGVEAPAIGDCGHVGIPSADVRKRRGDAQTFAYIHDGLAAIGLLSEEIEALHAFLVEHTGHPIRQYADSAEMDVDDDEATAPEGPPTRTLAFRFRERFPEAFHELACSCGDSYRSGSSERIRPFKAFRLSARHIALFRSNVQQVDDGNFYKVGGFPFDDLGHVAAFLRRHGGHEITVRLTKGDTSTEVSARKSRPAAPKWVPPEWSPAESEGFLGPVSDAELLYSLRDENPAVRAEAAHALGSSAEGGALGYLVSLFDDPVVAVRVAAVRAIARIRDNRRPRALGHALADESHEVRAALREALAEAGISEEEARRRSRKIVGPFDLARTPKLQHDAAAISMALRHPRSRQREVAIEAAERLRVGDAHGLLVLALADPSHAIRSAAARALSRHRDPRTRAALLRATREYGTWTRSSAAESLGALGVAEALPWLREVLLANRPGDVLPSTACQALANIGGDEAIAILADGLQHESADIRQHVCGTLGQMRTAKAVPALARALADREENVRVSAAYALAELQSPDAFEALVTLYRSHSDRDREAAFAALLPLKHPRMLRVLVAALRDRSSLVRERAASGLAERGDARGIRALLAGARRGDGDVARGAWRLLVAIGDPATERALIGALWDPNQQAGVKRAACYLACGNPRLASAVSKWLPGGLPRPRTDGPRWGQGLSTR